MKLLGAVAFVFLVAFTSRAQTVISGGASVSGNATIGVSPHYVELDWTVSISSDVIGYNIYRGPSGGPYVMVSTMPTVGAKFFDLTVQAGQTDCYVATAVDLAGDESEYSNEACATIPGP